MIRWRPCQIPCINHLIVFCHTGRHLTGSPSYHRRRFFCTEPCYEYCSVKYNRIGRWSEIICIDIISEIMIFLRIILRTQLMFKFISVIHVQFLDFFDLTNIFTNDIIFYMSIFRTYYEK